ncbi:zinc finger protein [Ditylenchus destructor]|nr:zinc finger protein [Ditylenchus destructor]
MCSFLQNPKPKTQEDTPHFGAIRAPLQIDPFQNGGHCPQQPPGWPECRGRRSTALCYVCLFVQSTKECRTLINPVNFIFYFIFYYSHAPVNSAIANNTRNGYRHNKPIRSTELNSTTNKRGRLAQPPPANQTGNKAEIAEDTAEKPTKARGRPPKRTKEKVSPESVECDTANSSAATIEKRPGDTKTPMTASDSGIESNFETPNTDVDTGRERSLAITTPDDDSNAQHQMEIDEHPVKPKGLNKARMKPLSTSDVEEAPETPRTVDRLSLKEEPDAEKPQPEEELDHLDHEEDEDSSGGSSVDQAARRAASRQQDLIICAECCQQFTTARFDLYLEHKISGCSTQRRKHIETPTSATDDPACSLKLGSPLVRGGVPTATTFYGAFLRQHDDSERRQRIKPGSRAAQWRKDCLERDNRLQRSSSVSLLHDAKKPAYLYEMPGDRRLAHKEVAVDTSDFDDAAQLGKEINRHSVVRLLTCHSCKHKCRDIWGLLEHVFVAHGVRLSDENLPGFDYPAHTKDHEKSSKDSVKDVERARPQLLERQSSNSILASMSTPPPVHGANVVKANRSLSSGSKSAFSLNAFCSERLKEIAERVGSVNSGVLRSTATHQPQTPDNALATALQQSNFQNMGDFLQPQMLAAMQNYYIQLNSLNNNPAATLLGLAASTPASTTPGTPGTPFSFLNSIAANCMAANRTQLHNRSDDLPAPQPILASPAMRQQSLTAFNSPSSLSTPTRPTTALGGGLTPNSPAPNTGLRRKASPMLEHIGGAQSALCLNVSDFYAKFWFIKLEK